VTARILLVGMMGAGKTTVGQLLAAELGWDYSDSDADVEEDTGMTVPELFVAKGEEVFRNAEAHALERACAGTAPCVISVAGGAVLRVENRALITSSGTVVWLRADPATLAQRVGHGEDRPLLGDDPLATLTALGTVRSPLYAEVSDLTIDVDALTPADVAARILAAAPAPS
jgi:shikimate kinase